MLTIEEKDELAIAIATAQKNCKDNYALAYLRAIPQSQIEYGDYGLKVQLLYCLGNMQTWRGPIARETKLIFKKMIKKMEKKK